MVYYVSVTGGDLLLRACLQYNLLKITVDAGGLYG